jgi:hypothetical protein
MKIFLITIVLLFSFPSVVQACFYNEKEAQNNLAKAVYIGKVEIINVEPDDIAPHSRPTVTYKILEAEKRAADFTDDIVKIEGGPLSSCDALGPWKVGMVLNEAFFIENGKLRAETLNMKLRHVGNK